MLKTGIDHEALIDMIANAGAKGSAQVRKAVGDATLAALQGRELTLKNIRAVLKSVTQATSSGAAKNVLPAVDVESLLDNAVAGMDEALVKAVQANKVALQQFVNQGADLREKHLKKAVADLEKMEDTFIDALKKSTDAAGSQVTQQWAPVLDKMRAGGTQSGAQAATTAEQFISQMQTAVRDSRTAGLRAAQTLADSYAALVSGVLIGMSDALAQAAPDKPRKK
jgi:2-succinyl-5-enolpyruvyl-6-hydroxy-3-cyclohexene-1-carboxylate synthase